MSVRPVEPDPHSRAKVTAPSLAEKRRRGEPITMVTAYDFPTARPPSSFTASMPPSFRKRPALRTASPGSAW